MKKELELAAFRSLIEEARDRGDQEFIEKQRDELVSTYCDLIEGVSTDKLLDFDSTDLPEELYYLEVINDKTDFSERVSWFLSLTYYHEDKSLEKSIECAKKALSELDQWLREEALVKNKIEFYHYTFRASFFLVAYEKDTQNYRKLIKDNIAKLIDLDNDEIEMKPALRAEILCSVYLYELLKDEICFPALREKTYKTLKEWGRENPEVVRKMIDCLGVDRGETHKLPNHEYEFWFDTLLGFVDKGSVVVDPYLALAHSFAKLGKKLKSEKYLRQALKLFQKGVYDKPHSWPAYLYCAQTCQNLAELSDHSKWVWLEQAYHFFLEGSRQAPSASIIFPAGRFCNEYQEFVRGLGLSPAEHIELLLDGERLGEGFHWNPYQNLFNYYWLNKNRNEAFSWALRGWIKKSCVLDGEWQIVEAQLKTLPTPEIEQGLKVIKEYQESSAVKVYGEGLSATAVADLREMSLKQLLNLIARFTTAS